MVETFSYKDVTVKIFEIQANNNILLNFKLFNKQGEEIPFLPTGSTVSSYKIKDKDLLIQDAKLEIDNLRNSV